MVVMCSHYLGIWAVRVLWLKYLTYMEKINIRQCLLSTESELDTGIYRENKSNISIIIHITIAQGTRYINLTTFIMETALSAAQRYTSTKKSLCLCTSFFIVSS